jgi:UDP-glucose 6-dehydrogenase
MRPDRVVVGVQNRHRTGDNVKDVYRPALSYATSPSSSPRLESAEMINMPQTRFTCHENYIYQ